MVVAKSYRYSLLFRPENAFLMFYRALKKLSTSDATYNMFVVVVVVVQRLYLPLR